MSQNPPEAGAPVLELVDVVKRFPGVLANDRVSLKLYPGEILALLGENGAGKTTLMNILYGLLPPDRGTILVRGKAVRFESPADAMAAGIGMVHQHFMLVPVMTVAENVVLGAEPVRRRLFVDREEALRRVGDISAQFGLRVDPGARTGELPVGVQQRVEIVKVLYRKASVLILDEPTAVLTPQEVEDLFTVLRNLVQAGHSIIFITHKLKEALEIADRIMVLRAGRVVGETTPGRTTEADLAAMMVGHGVALEVDRGTPHPAGIVFRADRVWVLDDRGSPAVRGASFTVRAGEVLGIAGVQGNGQTELMQAVVGLRPLAGGRVEILGSRAEGLSVRRLQEMGLAYVPEDRQRDGLVLTFPVYENLALNAYYKPPLAKRASLSIAALKQRAEELVRTFDIRTPSVETPVGTLSGGNQQKVIMAREFSRPIRLLVASQPTRGLDVASVEYIHRRILEQRDAGAGVVLVSNELDEIMAVSDRIAVMYRGQIVALGERDEFDRQRLGLLMAGVAA